MPLEIFNNPDFLNQDNTTKQKVLNNYFDSEMADNSFKALKPEEQLRIKNNFITSTLGTKQEDTFSPAKQESEQSLFGRHSKCTFKPFANRQRAIRATWL